jgi:hypothetical protein
VRESIEGCFLERERFSRILPEALTGTSFLAVWIARQIFSAVNGMSIWLTPNSASASSNGIGDGAERAGRAAFPGAAHAQPIGR